MREIYIATIETIEQESKISKPKIPIHLDRYPELEPRRVWELANLVRIADRDYQCFNDWFNQVEDENDVIKEFTLEKDRKFKGIKPQNNHNWIYVTKEINHSATDRYTLMTEKDLQDNDLMSKYPDSKYYKYKILQTYEYMAYYPAKLDVDINRFGFVAERKEGDKQIAFIVFRGTRELGEWFSNAQFKQVNFLEEEDYDGIEGCGKISLGFNKMYTGFRPGILIDYKNINNIARKGDAFFRNILRKIDNTKIEYKSIFHAIQQYCSVLEANANVYIAGHSLGGALATIATMHIAEANKLAKPINLYTFASPRVGDNTFADRFNQLTSQGKINAFRFANSEDIVTKVPFPVWFRSEVEMKNNPLLELTTNAFNRATGGVFDKDYQHVGMPIYFTHQAYIEDDRASDLQATIGGNHNLTQTYCGALEQIKIDLYR